MTKEESGIIFTHAKCVLAASDVAIPHVPGAEVRSTEGTTRRIYVPTNQALLAYWKAFEIAQRAPRIAHTTDTVPPDTEA